MNIYHKSIFSSLLRLSTTCFRTLLSFFNVYSKKIRVAINHEFIANKKGKSQQTGTSWSAFSFMLSMPNWLRFHQLRPFVCHCVSTYLWGSYRGWFFKILSNTYLTVQLIQFIFTFAISFFCLLFTVKFKNSSCLVKRLGVFSGTYWKAEF